MMKLKRKLKTGPVWNPLLSLNTLCVLYHLTLIFSILFIVADTNIFSLSLSLHLSGLLHYRQILHTMGFSRQEYWIGVPLPSPVLALLQLKARAKASMCGEGAAVF